MRLFVIALPLLISCSPAYQTIGVYNITKNEIVIETRPAIRYNGLPEKYMGIEKDSTGRGIVWKFGDINSIVIFPKTRYGDDSLGIYIMKPHSGFTIGDLRERRDLTNKDIKLDYLKIVNQKDTVVADSKTKIWTLINYDRKKRKDKRIRYSKAIVID